MERYKYNNVLVLASGGVLGTSWHVATLKRLELVGEININDYDLIIGTSAGSLAASLFLSELRYDNTLKILRGDTVTMGSIVINKPNLNYYTDIKRENKIKEYYKYLLKIKKFPKIGFFLTNLISTGQSTLEPLAESIDLLHKNSWPEKDLWIISSSKTNNSRIIINKYSGVPIGAAVISSCSVPGLYKPTLVKGHDTLDGGVTSSHSMDIAIKTNPEKITILAPLSTFSRFSRRKPLLYNIISLIRTYEEFILRFYLNIAKIKGIKVKVYRPRKKERAILSTGIMNDDRVEELIKATLLVE